MAVENDKPRDEEPNDEEIDPNAVYRIAISYSFDLHSFHPRDVKAAVEEYLNEAYRHGMRELRIVHGRGIGVQREIVRSVLTRTEFVASYKDAAPDEGGWGATLVVLKPKPAAV